MSTTAKPSLQPWPTLAWLVGSLVASAVVGQLAWLTKPWFDPLIIQPLTLGLVCGLACTLGMWFWNVGHRPALLTGAVLAGLAAVLAQHYAGYMAYLSEWETKTSGVGALVNFDVADSFPAYIKRLTDHGLFVFGWRLIGWQLWAYWVAEAVLVEIGALLVVWPMSKQSYCAGCHSWYRVVRQGTVPNKAVRQLAQTFKLPSEKLTLNYKLYACRTGCGTPAVELAWPASGEVGEGRRAVWLEADQYQEFLALLDGGR